MPKWVARLAVISLAALIALEILIRVLGLVDFPIYKRAPGVGYTLLPNQGGKFLNRNQWFVNSTGLINKNELTAASKGCLLVGDSIVYGGNPVDYYHRVGYLAESISRRPVWVVAAGGWNLVNELSFLEANVRQLSALTPVVFVINGGDLGAPGRWSGQFAFPTKKPAWASLYILNRYVLRRQSELPPISDAVAPSYFHIWQNDFRAVRSAYRGEFLILLYPDQNDLRDRGEWLRRTQPLRKFVASIPSTRLVDTYEYWHPSLYRDGVHPNSKGNAVLSRLIALGCNF